MNPQFPILEPETSVYQDLSQSVNTPELQESKVNVETMEVTTEMSLQQGLTLDDDILEKGYPTCEDIHMRNDKIASSHEIRIYDVCQHHQGGIEQVGVGQGKLQHNVRQSKSNVSERMSGEEPTCEDDHVKNDHDIEWHAIGIHDVSQYHKGEAKPIGTDNGLLSAQEQEGQGNPSEVQQGWSEDSNHDERSPNDPKEYWRPSYMFQWLRCIGASVKESYKHFEKYKGKQSYDELQLQPPTSLGGDGDDIDCSEWSHMSDYDEFGKAPEEAQVGINGTATK